MIRVLVLCCLSALWLVAEEPSAALADRILAVVQAADQARQRLADEQAAWRAEEARVAALLALVEHQAETLEAQAAQDRQTAAALEDAGLSPAPAPAAAIEDLLRAETVAFAAALADRQPRLPPELWPLPADGALAEAEALVLWSDALRRWRELVARAEGWGLSLEDARDAAGQPRAVQVLRAGTAALWWLAVDDAQAGVARMQDGQLRLLPAADPAAAAAIRAAVAMLRGRREAGLLVLPFDALPLTPVEQP